MQILQLKTTNTNYTETKLDKLRKASKTEYKEFNKHLHNSPYKTDEITRDKCGKH